MLPGRIRDLHLVPDAPEEGLVAQLRWRQVGREHQQHIERYFYALPGLEAQVVPAPVHRDDPAVEELPWLYDLPAEVVDDEDAAIGLHLQGRDVELRHGVET